MIKKLVKLSMRIHGKVGQAMKGQHVATFWIMTVSLSGSDL